MPPRQPQLPPGKPRRRNGPVMSGGWVWLVVVAVVLMVILFIGGDSFTSGGTIKYSEFLHLLDQGCVKEVNLVGTERANGELDPDKFDKLTGDIKDQVKQKLHNRNRFTTLRPPGDDHGK